MELRGRVSVPRSDHRYDPAAHYDRVTEAWRLLLGDELHYGLFTTGLEDLPSATRALTDRMIAAARIDRGDEILDVGCGSGAPACDLAARLGAHVVGISTSAVGIAQAQARAAAAGLTDRTRFEVRDGMDNGFPDGSFDRIWVLESSHLMRERARLVAECARVLRPGGRLALCDIVLRRPMPFEEVRRLRTPLQLLRDVFGDARMEPLDQYVELVEAAGLDVDVRDDLTTATRPTFSCWRQNATRHRDTVESLLGGEELDRFVRACDVLEGLWDDGTLGYGLIAASRPR